MWYFVNRQHLCLKEQTVYDVLNHVTINITGQQNNVEKHIQLSMTSQLQIYDN